MNLQTVLQGQGTAGFFDFVASMIGDLLGVEVDGKKLHDEYMKHGLTSSMGATGKAFINQLMDEMKPQQGGDLKPGLDAMMAFMGFVLAFSGREANIEVLSRALTHIPVLGEYLDFSEVRSYSVDMARNIGLGRLVYQAMRPFLQTMASIPMQWQLNKQFHPTKVIAGDLIRWRKKRLIEHDYYIQEMEILGYRPVDAEQFENEPIRIPNAQELLNQIIQKQLTRDQAVNLLMSYEYTQQEAENLMDAQDYQLVRTHWRTMLDHVFTSVVDGHITKEQAIGTVTSVTSGIRGDPNTPAITVGGLVGDLPLGDSEKVAIAYVIGKLADLPRTILSQSQIDTALANGFILLSDWETYTRLHGYSEDVISILRDQALLKKPTAGANTISKNITLGDAKKALKNGVFTTDQFRAYLKDVGYTDSAADTMVQIYSP